MLFHCFAHLAFRNSYRRNSGERARENPLFTRIRLTFWTIRDRFMNTVSKWKKLPNNSSTTSRFPKTGWTRAGHVCLQYKSEGSFWSWRRAKFECKRGVGTLFQSCVTCCRRHGLQGARRKAGRSSAQGESFRGSSTYLTTVSTDAFRGPGKERRAKRTCRLSCKGVG